MSASDTIPAPALMACKAAVHRLQAAEEGLTTQAQRRRLRAQRRLLARQTEVVQTAETLRPPGCE